MLNDVTVFNIREYLSAKGDKDLGEDELRQLLSEFFCDKNPDVEKYERIANLKKRLEKVLKPERLCDRISLLKNAYMHRNEECHDRNQERHLSAAAD